MKPLGEWKQALAQGGGGGRLDVLEGRGGEPTLKVGSIYLHSRYNPREEAKRLVDSAELDLKRPVLVVGLGLGYHVAELQARGVEHVAVIEPDEAVVRCALDAGILEDALLLVGCGDPDAVAASDAFRAFAARTPQILIHPPTARLDPAFVEAVTKLTCDAALRARRLHVAVVGPMYGGSLPIAGYLERAFRKLGHETLLVDNVSAWPLYEQMTEGLKTKQAARQLGAMCSSLLSEWTYARVAEFAPDICVVMAQAPVRPQFPLRLAKEGIVTAFWYVENWRHLPYWKDIAKYYDYFFHIQPGEFEAKLDEAGCRAHAFIQTACDPEIHRPVQLTPDEEREYGCDLSFAGAGYRNRIQVLSGLTDYDLKIWGVNWFGRDLRAHVCRAEQRFDAQQFAKIVAGSKINLNLHSSAAHDGVDPTCDAINPRVFEIAACGGFQVCDPAIGLDRYFDFETELPVYRTLAELRSRIDYFLEHPDERRAIAERARERVLCDHTYERRAQDMLDLIVDRYGPRVLRKGVRVQRTVAEMAERVGRDSPLGQYLGTLPPDLSFTHESINEHVARSGRAQSYPEKLFCYLREVRDFAETLLELR
ncbi:MAG TPA: hypothetical protein ENN80_00705 [Candidatus Hydrogenedentes bacterium]|nr:hypothetical protein [Candidatus Hydrogenedentota bacterium]